MSFEVTIVELPEKHLIGMKVVTNMQKAQTDCPAMWQTFGPRIIEIPGGGDIGKEAYGISVMANESDFDYWTAIEAAPETMAPDGMSTIDLPAGPYAQCSVPNLDRLSEAYMFLWTQWLQGQKEYAYNEQAPSFELYPANWRMNDAFEIYMPLRQQ